MPFKDKKKHHILVSRIDAIGDVILTLPLCSYYKSIFPNSIVSFLARTYTLPVIKICGAIDNFINYDELKSMSLPTQVNYLKNKNIDVIIHVFPNKYVATLAKKAGIGLRIGTANRLYHWLTCNKLVKLSRKNSDLHEAQLNLKLLRPFGLNYVPSLPDIIKTYDMKPIAMLPKALKDLFSKDKFNLILHPKSHGSGMEWDTAHFSRLIKILPKDTYNVIITGSEKEKKVLKNWIAEQPDYIIDVIGKMSLEEFITFIYLADGLLACGTGPLHIAAALGINTLGLFPSVKPIHIGRWAPLGKKAHYIESGTVDINSISETSVYEKISQWRKV